MRYVTDCLHKPLPVGLCLYPDGHSMSAMALARANRPANRQLTRHSTKNSEGPTRVVLDSKKHVRDRDPRPLKPRISAAGQEIGGHNPVFRAALLAAFQVVSCQVLTVCFSTFVTLASASFGVHRPNAFLSDMVQIAGNRAPSPKQKPREYSPPCVKKSVLSPANTCPPNTSAPLGCSPR